MYESKEKKYEKRRTEVKRNLKVIWTYLKLPFIFKPVLFIFLVTLAPGISEAMFYYQTGVLHFSAESQSFIFMAGSLADMAGIVIYRQFFRQMKFSSIMVITTLGMAVTQASNLFLVRQQTESLLGLSPYAFVLIQQVLYFVFMEIHLMPIMVLACKICPKKVEATFYAFVLAIINAGYLLSYSMGGALTHFLHITATDFTHFWILILISSLFPIVTLFALFMVPDSDQIQNQLQRYFEIKKQNREKDFLPDSQKNIRSSFGES